MKQQQAMPESNLVSHARRELELCGQTAEDPEFAQSLIDAVEAFASYGHSGGSAMVGVEMLHDLLQFKALSPLTDDPAEWLDHSHQGVRLWQSKRDPAVFTEDEGRTAYSVEGSGRSPVTLRRVKVPR